MAKAPYLSIFVIQSQLLVPNDDLKVLDLGREAVNHLGIDLPLLFQKRLVVMIMSRSAHRVIYSVTLVIPKVGLS